MKIKNPFKKAIIGGIKVKNRFFRSATHERAALNGKSSKKIAEMYRKLALGEVGLIITGWMGFSGTDYPGEKTVMVKEDSSILELKETTKTVHKHGTKIIAQLNHAGSQLFHRVKGPVYGPSKVIDPASGIRPISFTLSQLKNLIAEFGDAALRLKKSEFDGVQIHCAHGYLLSKFLSPTFNTRDDLYGGSLAKNTQIILDIINDVRMKCGKNFPIWVKMNSSDFHKNGEGFRETDFLNVAKKLVKNGIDAIEVSGGTLYGQYSPMRSKKHEAYHFESAKKLSDKIEATVILVGGLRKIEIIEEIISKTNISAVSLARPLIREPELIKRWHEGNREDSECIACNFCFNPKGTKCFFKLGDKEKNIQKKLMEKINFKK